MKLFLSPHNDDETLFGAFTILREKPLVVIVFDSHLQFDRGTGVTAIQRRTESMNAMIALGMMPPKFLGFSDAEAIEPAIEAAFARLGRFEMVYAPADEEQGHAQHNLVARLADRVFDPVTHYLTYTRTRGKSASDHPVPIEKGEWIAAKLRALACYGSQHAIDSRLGCWPHFLRDQTEYYQ